MFGINSILRFPSPGSVKCLYQGGFIPYRGIPELLEASGDSQFKDINFIFMGHGGMTEWGKFREKIVSCRKLMKYSSC